MKAPRPDKISASLAPNKSTIKATLSNGSQRHRRPGVMLLIARRRPALISILSRALLRHARLTNCRLDVIAASLTILIVRMASNNLCRKPSYPASNINRYIKLDQYLCGNEIIEAEFDLFAPNAHSCLARIKRGTQYWRA